jgi:hypothetical protein
MGFKANITNNLWGSNGNEMVNSHIHPLSSIGIPIMVIFEGNNPPTRYKNVLEWLIPGFGQNRDTLMQWTAAFHQWCFEQRQTSCKYCTNCNKEHKPIIDCPWAQVFSRVQKSWTPLVASMASMARSQEATSYTPEATKELQLLYTVIMIHHGYVSIWNLSNSCFLKVKIKSLRIIN